jgi:hypothetical protein
MENIKNNTQKTKRTYIKPKMKKLGSVKQLTLKSGSNTDGFGNFN